MKCKACGSNIVSDPYYWDAWQGLMYTIETLHSEGSITEQTLEKMTDRLMIIKSLICKEGTN